jgi:hypothetical protein
MSRSIPLFCSVGLHRWQSAGQLGLGAAPVRVCTKCPTQHIVYWGGTTVDVTPLTSQPRPVSQRRWFRVLSSLAAGALIGLACGIFLLSLMGDAVGSTLAATTLTEPTLLTGTVLGSAFALLFAALRRGFRIRG